MRKIIGLCIDGAVCGDNKTYWISDISRKALKEKGFKNAYLSTVGGFNTVVYKK